MTCDGSRTHSQSMEHASVLTLPSHDRGHQALGGAHVPQIAAVQPSPGALARITLPGACRRTSCPVPQSVASKRLSSDGRNSIASLHTIQSSYTCITGPKVLTSSLLNDQGCSKSMLTRGVVSPLPPMTDCELSPLTSPRFTRMGSSLAIGCTYSTGISGHDYCRSTFASDLPTFRASPENSCTSMKVSERLGKTVPGPKDHTFAVPLVARLECNVPSWVELPNQAPTMNQAYACDLKTSPPTSATVSTCSFPHHDEEEFIGQYPQMSFAVDGMRLQITEKSSSGDGSNSSLVDPWSSRRLLPAPASSSSKVTSKSHDRISVDVSKSWARVPAEVASKAADRLGNGPHSRSILELVATVEKKLSENADLHSMVERSGNGPHSRSILELVAIVEKKLTDNADLYDMVEKLCPHEQLTLEDSDTDAPATSDSETLSGLSVDDLVAGAHTLCYNLA